MLLYFLYYLVYLIMFVYQFWNCQKHQNFALWLFQGEICHYLSTKSSSVRYIFVCIFSLTNGLYFYVFQALEWIHDYGEAYLASHTNLGNDKNETEALLKEHYEFRNRAKVRCCTITDWKKNLKKNFHQVFTMFHCQTAT